MGNMQRAKELTERRLGKEPNEPIEAGLKWGFISAMPLVVFTGLAGIDIEKSASLIQIFMIVVLGAGAIGYFSAKKPHAKWKEEFWRQFDHLAKKERENEVS